MSTRDNEETLVTSKPHIMFVSYPLQGHMNPMIQFSKRLLSKGIKVTIVTTTNMETSSLAKTTSINIEQVSVDEPSLKGDTPDIIDEFLVFYEIGMARSLPEVIEKQKTNGCPVKILIYDALMPWALDISHKQGIQGVAFCTHSSAVFAIYSNVYSRTFDIDSFGELSTVKLPALPLLRFKDLPSLVYEMGLYKGLSRLVVSQFQGMEKADCVLFNTFDKLENEFAKRLSSKGAGVTIITPFSANLISGNQNKSINIEYVSYDHEGKPITSVEDHVANLEKKASHKLLEVLEKQKSSCGQPFDVLVHDSLFPWGVDFGHQHGLRAAIFFTQPCAISSIFYLVYQGKIKYPVQEGADLSFLPDQIPISHVKDLPYDLYHERYAGTLDMLGGQFSNVDNADWIFFNTFLGLENEVSSSSLILSVYLMITICDFAVRR